MHEGIAPGASVLASYEALAAEGKLQRDPAQVALAERLDRLNIDIGSSRLASKSSALGWLFAKSAPKREAIRGLYIHGSVGRGKTMLMDIFFAACPHKRKRRAHFNDFMADVHDRIGAYRKDLKDGNVKGDDPIAPVAKTLANEARIVCFDEFSVTDIADAMILSRLFSALFAEGVVLVATSNVMPRNLYKDGLNRSLFLPFVDTLERHVDVVSLDADRDYRLDRLADTDRYMVPLGPTTDAAMDEAWLAITGGKHGTPATVHVKGRDIRVPQAVGPAARFTFADLCEQPLGARDYLAICKDYKTIFLDRVPVISAGKRNEAKRFITLVDTFYDQHINPVISADAEPTELYQAKSGTEAFEFERTASRLIEMRGADWVKGGE